MRLEGKVAVVTGAAGGIGRAICLRFSDEGARVLAADMDERGAATTAAACRDARAQHVDVTDTASVRALYEQAGEHFGGVDVLVNNAGIMPAEDRSAVDTDEETWARVQAVNATGVYLCCRHGIPHLLERGGGSVVNMASFVALMGAATPQIAYTASKGAVLAMSRELAVELARSGVRVNALCPGPVETPLLAHLFAGDADAFERRRVHLPMGRLARPDEVASAALFLASDDASYMTGAALLVDGGITAAYVTPD
jgi:NAD(P)-dependent dehydrogenase (short-subunit alcohol dehydrogenase family)